ncbi:hypothetical protein PIB30_016604 [Stylosanthes scabra]|uniref:Uncharacterized protein n=1 Tax=Stylosanthes scabra TaxID=79078 RepID=A0ABU6T876_9FABA|nr:hypothetical protein [Stylosanthes scabra]
MPPSPKALQNLRHHHAWAWPLPGPLLPTPNTPRHLHALAWCPPTPCLPPPNHATPTLQRGPHPVWLGGPKLSQNQVAAWCGHPKQPHDHATFKLERGLNVTPASSSTQGTKDQDLIPNFKSKPNSAAMVRSVNVN